MNTLTKETASVLANLLSSSVTTCYNDDLVAILGTGREPDNKAAIQSWLLSRLPYFEQEVSDRIMAHSAAMLDLFLNDVRVEIAIGFGLELPLQNDFIPSKELSNQELRCIARSIYLLMLGEGTRTYLDALIRVALGGDDNVVDSIAAWLSSQVSGYVYNPSELTIPLAQRFMKKLKQVSETY
ncbi:Uncharacterised protein [Zhongshania aliphaticivorans]|uniref:Uncharacterized protein n=1 Tax=Zhongshania aliphaticivorans TaxID=1470434 RepID=A0A5S9NTL7_9GAMM|nr:hypothetical protein [Zhongshania aliphaticivorans]CAA0094024.1 Uncharacterised protein [Zhongshania aliphaticivorans]CAA0112125.1 Uncharacterised protein [Zhongshania aliphaticivorans]